MRPPRGKPASLLNPSADARSQAGGQEPRSEKPNAGGRRGIYCALTGDIVGSGEAPNRAGLQRLILRSLRVVNRKFGADLVTPFVLTLGDEFQGVLRSPVQAHLCVGEFERLLYPAGACFGLGVGGVTTKLAGDSRQMDGSCFRFSREALTTAKKEGRLLVVQSDCSWLDLAVNSVLLLLGAIKSSWEEVHYRRTWLYDELGTMRRVAERERVSIPAVRKTLVVGKFGSVRRAQENLAILMGRYLTPEG